MGFGNTGLFLGWGGPRPFSLPTYAPDCGVKTRPGRVNWVCSPCGTLGLCIRLKFFYSTILRCWGGPSEVFDLVVSRVVWCG